MRTFERYDVTGFDLGKDMEGLLGDTVGAMKTLLTELDDPRIESLIATDILAHVDRSRLLAPTPAHKVLSDALIDAALAIVADAKARGLTG